MKYRIDRQLSVNLRNAPGQLAELSDLLARHDVNLSAITINSAESEGLFRFTASEPEAAQAALRAAGYRVEAEEVLSIQLQDSKGKLATLTRTLSDSGINVDYMYASIDEQGARSRLILKVSNVPLAARVISEIMATAAA